MLHRQRTIRSCSLQGLGKDREEFYKDRLTAMLLKHAMDMIKKNQDKDRFRSVTKIKGKCNPNLDYEERV